MPDPGFSKMAEVERAQQRLDADTKIYLQDCGWRYRCDTPGSQWLWQRTLADGRIVMVEQATAVRFQQIWENKDFGVRPLAEEPTADHPHAAFVLPVAASPVTVTPLCDCGKPIDVEVTTQIGHRLCSDCAGKT